MRNEVKVNGQDYQSPTFGELEIGQMYRLPAGQAVYMKVFAGTLGYSVGINLATGEWYDVLYGKEVRPIRAGEIVTIKVLR